MDLSFLDIDYLKFDELLLLSDLDEKERDLYYKLDKIYIEHIRPLFVKNFYRDPGSFKQKSFFKIEKNILENICSYNEVDVETFCNFLIKSGFSVIFELENYKIYCNISLI